MKCKRGLETTTVETNFELIFQCLVPSLPLITSQSSSLCSTWWCQFLNLLEETGCKSSYLLALPTAYLDFSILLRSHLHSSISFSASKIAAIASFQTDFVRNGFIPFKKKSLSYSFTRIYQQEGKVKACPLCSLNLNLTLKKCFHLGILPSGWFYILISQTIKPRDRENMT